MTEKIERGFKHVHSESALRKWMAMPADMKLNWLEEINLFLWKCVPEKNKDIIEKFRRAEI
ncbi:MAG TPA: hypothetical protein ENH13_05435 [Euryarchaeota archaeon]|nr:hypothetical protein BMS3Abin16_00263 [archaeon BMS3Abin16]GBE56159.1 hypothetical protein BMS3Bbin16_00358 [archaeon BMS3Bbin16]HDH28425.1 hypothetical protein [Euryarchaeota archaeon]HDH28557.1 hypothetical protein [Euryarchaeota archaeon]